MVNNVNVPRRWLQQVFHEIVAYQVCVVWRHESVVFSGENEHVEAFARFDEGIGQPVGGRRRDILVHVACHQQQLAFQIACQFCVGGDVGGESCLPVYGIGLFLQPVERFAPPLYVDVVVVVARGGYAHFVEVWIGQHGCRSLETSSRVSVNAHAVEVNEGIAAAQFFNGVLVVGQRIVAQVAITEAIEVVPAPRGTAARSHVDDHEA